MKDGNKLPKSFTDWYNRFAEEYLVIEAPDCNS